MRELIRRALLKEGYIPRCASTGKEALSLAKGCSLVLLDIVLPDVHGLSLCAEFKHLPGGEI
ncbi:MAG TPA: DNA-binding response regulator, partial [Clostridiales bacterium]|nr:DNA-binding response regulator [Clostridiales bacterium]